MARSTTGALFVLALSFQPHCLHTQHRVPSVSWFECIASRLRRSALLAHGSPDWPWVLPKFGQTLILHKLGCSLAMHASQKPCVTPSTHVCCSIELNMSYAYQQVSSFFNRDVSPLCWTECSAAVCAQTAGLMAQMPQTVSGECTVLVGASSCARFLYNALSEQLKLWCVPDWLLVCRTSRCLGWSTTSGLRAWKRGTTQRC